MSQQWTTVGLLRAESRFKHNKGYRETQDLSDALKRIAMCDIDEEVAVF